MTPSPKYFPVRPTGISPRTYTLFLVVFASVMVILYQTAPIVIVIKSLGMHRHRNAAAKMKFGRHVLHDASKSKSAEDVDDDLVTSTGDVFFFNRVPKTGSENFVHILRQLSDRNGFVHERYRSPEPRRLLRGKQARQVRAVRELAEANAPRPLSYDRHVYFIDFRRFGAENPFYFSMVRDPIAKFESRYFYSRFNGGHMYDKLRKKNVSWIMNVSKEEYTKRKIEDCILQVDPECELVNGKKYDLTIPYFCGQRNECMELNSKWALDRAKQNVETWYPVVGVLEDLRSTLVLLESKLPKFFQGVTALYDAELKDVKRNRGIKRPKLSRKAYHALKSNLTMEIEFYNWVRQRLIKQSKEH